MSYVNMLAYHGRGHSLDIEAAVRRDGVLHYQVVFLEGVSLERTDQAAAYAAGALGVALSGSGPTLLAFAHGANQAIASALHQTFQRHGIACQIRPLQADTTGAVVL